MDLMKLPNTELEVMQVIWDKELEGPVSSKTVTDFFFRRKELEKNYNTNNTWKVRGKKLFKY